MADTLLVLQRCAMSVITVDLRAGEGQVSRRADGQIRSSVCKIAILFAKWARCAKSEDTSVLVCKISSRFCRIVALQTGSRVCVAILQTPDSTPRVKNSRTFAE
eukprot:2007495-Prymnesium_polylepis.1